MSEQSKMLPFPPMAHGGGFVGCIPDKKQRAVYAKAKHECGLSLAELDALLARELRVQAVHYIRETQFRHLMDTVLPRAKKPGHVNKKPRSTVQPLTQLCQTWVHVKTSIEHKEGKQ